MEVITGSCSLYFFYFLWCSQPSAKMEVIEGSCSLYFIIFYGVRSLRQYWTIVVATHLSYLTPYLTPSFTSYLTPET